MDFPRTGQRRRRHRRWLLGAALVAALAAGYSPLKQGAVSALESGARAGFELLGGAPALEPGSRAESAANAQWLEAASTPLQANAAPSHSGGLLSPAYTADGEIRLPARYAEWVFVGGATGLAYGEPAAETTADHPGTFTHVYLEPAAFAHFREHGTFPEGTTFALEMRWPTTGVSIARDGWFAGRSLGVHLAIKDTERLGGWAYFDIDRDGGAVRAPTSSCATCHARHGQVDNVFVQFYPVLTEAREQARP